MDHNLPAFPLTAFLLVSLSFCCFTPPASAQRVLDSEVLSTPTSDVLSPQQWKAVEKSLDRALAWMATRQQPNGAFQSPDVGQPAITSLVVMAFLSCGYLPGEGPYGQQLSKAIDFVLSCSRSGGLIALVPPDPQHGTYLASHTDIYNHAISGLMLCEAYGMTSAPQEKTMRTVIESALEFAMNRQALPKRHAIDNGGWRYIRNFGESDADLSVSSWMLFFMRSAKNSGFDVPVRNIDAAVGYVQRMFEERQGAFLYAGVGGERHATRAMTGAGILSLSLSGYHETDMAKRAGDWLLARGFRDYRGGSEDRYFYGAFYCTQAMFQLGGRYWTSFYPGLVDVYVANQNRDGSWAEESGGDSMFGNVYSTSLAVLALSTPYQLLPIYQR